MTLLMETQPVDGTRERRGEPWGARLWLALAAVVLVAGGLQSYGISTWPMAQDIPMR